MQKVELTYFKQTGKYYSEGEFKVDCNLEMYEIFAKVRSLLKARILPGLIKGHSNFIVSVNAPGHRHNYPALVIEEK